MNLRRSAYKRHCRVTVKYCAHYVSWRTMPIWTHVFNWTTNWVPVKCEIDFATEIDNGAQNIKDLIKAGISKWESSFHISINVISWRSKPISVHFSFCMFSHKSWHYSQCVWAATTLVINHAKWHTAALKHQLQPRKMETSSVLKWRMLVEFACWLRIYNFPHSAKDWFIMFFIFKNIRWRPAATQTLWTCCYESFFEICD